MHKRGLLLGCRLFCRTRNVTLEHPGALHFSLPGCELAEGAKLEFEERVVGHNVSVFSLRFASIRIQKSQGRDIRNNMGQD